MQYTATGCVICWLQGTLLIDQNIRNSAQIELGRVYISKIEDPRKMDSFIQGIRMVNGVNLSACAKGNSTGESRKERQGRQTKIICME